MIQREYKGSWSCVLRLTICAFLMGVFLFVPCGCSDDDPCAPANKPPSQPSNPSPSDGAVGVTTTPILSWDASDPEGDALTYDVYFGTSANPPFKTTSDSTTYDPESLAHNTTYYWKIVVRDEHGATTVGPVWTFATSTAPNQDPDAPSNPRPANGATDVSTTPTLMWHGSDPDGDALTYDVYFGTSPSPLQQTTDQSDTTYTPGTLSYATTYYWQIVVRDEHGSTTAGPIWSFTTVTNQAPPVPSDPRPPNGATFVTTTPTLMWDSSDPDGDDMTYDVYFGTNDPPATMVAKDHPDSTYTPGTLDYGTTYYWKIVVRDEHGAEAVGPVWSFKTSVAPNQPPDPPTNPMPMNGAVDVTTNPTLSWDASDPDGDALTYDVYFGTSPSPPQQTTDQTTTTYDPPGDLFYNTTYYWQIVVRDEHGATTAGPVWSFTTGATSIQ